MLQTTTSKRLTLIYTDALDEYTTGYQVNLFDSLNYVLQKSRGTRGSLARRPYIQAEIDKRLAARVTTIRMTHRRHDIISYLHTKLDEKTTRDTIDGSQEADILKGIPEDFSEVYIEATKPGKLP